MKMLVNDYVDDDGADDNDNDMIDSDTDGR